MPGKAPAAELVKLRLEAVTSAERSGVLSTDIPARLDRLNWSRWHVRIIVALGTSWILDGLEVTLVGSFSGILQSSHGLSLSDQSIANAASAYLAGAVSGALLFGHLTDRYGRRKLFLVTLATYSLATLGTGLSVGLAMFFTCRFLTGLGIGGEYAAINSAVDELIPAKLRGTVDLFVNATFWVGAMLGSLAATFLLGSLLPPSWSWRLAFLVGGSLGFAVLLLRLSVPESPRWLVLRGRRQEAERTIANIEKNVEKTRAPLPPAGGERLVIRPRDHTPWAEIFKNMLGENRQRSLLGLILMAGQAFFFNAVFFTFALVAKTFFHVPDTKLSLQLLPFALASFLGPLILGPLFDKIGRKPMITLTYASAAGLLAVTAIFFATSVITLKGMIICFGAIFFVASSAASAAYLTVSEIFPLEIRAFAIAIFYAIGTLIGGVGAPALFGSLIASGSRTHVMIGYLIGAALMLAGAIAEFFTGVEAAGRSLESVSKPLQSTG
jgi:MFS family permease